MLERRLVWLSAIAAVLYAAAFLHRSPSALRTVVKTAAVGALAVIAYLADVPWLLAAGLALSAVGDAFLAGDPDRWLPAGLGAFLLAHLLYIWFFLETGLGLASFAASPVRLAGAVAVFVLAAGMLAWLWRSLGAMRRAVSVYVGAIAVMVAASFTLPAPLWPAALGAVLFMLSDAVLSVELFKGLKSRVAAHAVWALYYLGQFAIGWAFVR